MKRRCERCGKEFEPRLPGHRFCPNCFSTDRPERVSRSTDAGLPEGYMAKGYFDGKGNLFEDYVVKWAEEIARRLGQGAPDMKRHQLRRFYNHVKTIERKLELAGDYDAINKDLKMLISHVSSAASASPAKVPRLFEEFIRTNVTSVKDDRTFQGFIDHFQAVVGFSERYLKKN
jgi:CRISPR type III-A-associated protein Csm2